MPQLSSDAWAAIIAAVISSCLTFVAAIGAIAYQFRNTDKRENDAEKSKSNSVKTFLRVEIQRNLERLKNYLTQVEERRNRDRREPHVPENVRPVLALVRTSIPRWQVRAWDTYKEHLVSVLGDDFSAVYEIYVALDDLSNLHSHISDMENTRRISLQVQDEQIRAAYPIQREIQDREIEESRRADPERQITRVPIPQRLPYEVIQTSYKSLQHHAVSLEADFSRIAKHLLESGNPLEKSNPS